MTVQDADNPGTDPRVDRAPADAGTGPDTTGPDDETRDPETGLPDVYRPGETTGPLTEEHEFPLWPDGRSRAATLTPPRPQAPTGPVRDPRRPGVGLPLLVVFALFAAFFAWVGAEPFWLAVGHADRGTVAVTRCTGGGVAKRCVGDFTAADGRYRVRTVPVSGGDARPGARLAARMVSSSARQAYVGDSLGLLLRWAVPLALVLLLGLLIALVTGAGRLRGRHRAAAVTLSLAGPLVVAAGLLAAAW
ncbi:MAG TPA: hypothetical protein VGN37_14655 [Actinocatenispora sp.]